MKTKFKKSWLAAATACALLPGVHAQESGPIRVGGLVTLEGPLAAAGEDGMRGLQMALQEANGMVAGRKIELISGSSDASPASAIRAARKLVEQDKVQILIGPASGSEGLAMKDYAKTQPNVTFVNGGSGAQDTTLRDPASNFFRFNMDGAQWLAGLGEYALKTKGYKRIAVVGEDYSFPHTQAFGFLHGYCKLGGKVAVRSWVPLGTKDYSSVIAALPDNIDAVLVLMSGSDSINFLTQYQKTGGQLPLIGGTMTVDQTVLGAKGNLAKAVIGLSAAGPVPDALDTPEWKGFVARYKAAYPKGFPSPSLFAYTYYVNTKAALAGLNQVNGDLSDGGKKYREALSKLEIDTPTGKVTLDHNRQATGTTFITEVARAPDGTLFNKVVKAVHNVNQTLGEPEADFLKYGTASRDNPNCN